MAEGVVRVGLEDKEQTMSKQDVRVEQKVSVALLDANCLREGGKDETIADSREGESEHRFRQHIYFSCFIYLLVQLCWGELFYMLFVQ